METPILNLLIFLFAATLIGILFWPRLRLFKAVRERLRTNKRTQLEDALKCIHNHATSDTEATVSTLSNALGMTPSKVSDLCENMKRAGLVGISDDRIFLTAEGQRYALQIVRAHRLWELYLADQTGVNPKDWHTQAEDYEHRISPEEVDSLADRLGNPLFDPHGDPIPSAEGEYDGQEFISLTELQSGSCARVMHMEDEPEDVFNQLVAQEIYVDMEFILKGRSGKCYVVEADGRSIEISPEAAQNLSVEQIEAVDKPDIAGVRETLNELRNGEVANIVQINPMCRGFERRRLMDLGILPNTDIQFYEDGLTGGLRAYSVRGTVLALRTEQTRMISIADRKRVKS